MKDFKAFVTILLFVGIIFLRSSLEKISQGQFVNSLGKILTGVAQKNPYPFYKNFLYSVAIPNSQLFGQLTMWGEFLSGVAITLGSLHLLFSIRKHHLAYLILVAGLIGGLFLNINFYLGFGYTSPSSDSLNLLMIFIELVGIITLFSGRKQQN